MADTVILINTRQNKVLLQNACRAIPESIINVKNDITMRLRNMIRWGSDKVTQILTWPFSWFFSVCRYQWGTEIRYEITQVFGGRKILKCWSYLQYLRRTFIVCISAISQPGYWFYTKRLTAICWGWLFSVAPRYIAEICNPGLGTGTDDITGFDSL